MSAEKLRELVSAAKRVLPHITDPVYKDHLRDAIAAAQDNTQESKEVMPNALGINREGQNVVKGAAHPDNTPTDEFAWLVENHEYKPHRYLSWDAGGFVKWTPDHLKACRFARRSDAEQVANGGELRDLKIVEHGWHNTPTDGAQKSHLGNGPGIPLDFPVGLHEDTCRMLHSFAESLGKKLRKAELKYGYSNGWKDPNWMDECRTKLLEHIDKGDPRDVAAYCAFLWYHGARTSSQPTPPADVGREDEVTVSTPVGTYVRHSTGNLIYRVEAVNVYGEHIYVSLHDGRTVHSSDVRITSPEIKLLKTVTTKHFNDGSITSATTIGQPSQYGGSEWDSERERWLYIHSEDLQINGPIEAARMAWKTALATKGTNNG